MISVYGSPEYVKELEGYLREKDAEIKRLRAGILPAGTFVGAVEYVDGLKAEAKRLRRERDDFIEARRLDLEEVDRLRAALEQIAAAQGTAVLSIDAPTIARQALEAS